MATASGVSQRGIYHPGNTSGGVPGWEELEQARSLLLERIHCSYQTLLDEIPERTRPSVLMRFLRDGFCFGLFDPVSNIVANTTVVSNLCRTADDAGASAVAVAGFDPAPLLKDMEQRSLNGLITFLTCLFPYLEDWEAVRYLLLADADPLPAAVLIAQG